MPGADIAYRFPSSQPRLKEGTVVGLYDRGGQQPVLDVLTPENATTAITVGVVSRSSYLEANVDQRHLGACDKICMIGLLDVRIEGACAAGDTVVSSQTYAGLGCRGISGPGHYYLGMAVAPSRVVETSLTLPTPISTVRCFVSVPQTLADQHTQKAMAAATAAILQQQQQQQQDVPTKRGGTVAQCVSVACAQAQRLWTTLAMYWPYVRAFLPAILMLVVLVFVAREYFFSVLSHGWEDRRWYLYQKWLAHKPEEDEENRRREAEAVPSGVSELAGGWAAKLSELGFRHPNPHTVLENMFILSAFGLVHQYVGTCMM